MPDDEDLIEEAERNGWIKSDGPEMCQGSELAAAISTMMPPCSTLSKGDFKIDTVVPESAGGESPAGPVEGGGGGAGDPAPFGGGVHLGDAPWWTPPPPPPPPEEPLFFQLARWFEDQTDAPGWIAGPATLIGGALGGCAGGALSFKVLGLTVYPSTIPLPTVPSGAGPPVPVPGFGPPFISNGGPLGELRDRVPGVTIVWDF